MLCNSILLLPEVCSPHHRNAHRDHRRHLPDPLRYDLRSRRPNVVENKVDFTNSRNVIVAALILVLAIGINYSVGSIQIGIVSLSGLAVASLVGIAVNAILPGKDYEFGTNEQGDTSVNFGTRAE